jgi:hypothetical protein
MNEIEGMKWHLGRYQAGLLQQIDRLYNALEELQRTTLVLLKLTDTADEQINKWLEAESFKVDDDGFFQNNELLKGLQGRQSTRRCNQFFMGTAST